MKAARTIFWTLFATWALLPAKGAVSLASFEAKAKKGAELNVVFFGGSLTWGANSTDPQLYSYRALLGEKLRNFYPLAHFHLWDAAIGGTTSQLGVFRLDRDVLSHKPDLVFLEFTVNDRLDEAHLSSYEVIVRRTIDAGCPIMVVILPVRQDALGYGRNQRHLAHEAVADAYQVPWVDVTDPIAQQVRSGAVKVEDLWANPNWPNPHDTTHPGDLGYKLYADAIWDAFLSATKTEEKIETDSKPMQHAPTYLHTLRRRLAEFGTLPQGWAMGQPDRTSAAYDFLMSRWLDSVAIAARRTDEDNPGSLACRFIGSSVLVFGEATLKSGKYRVLIDGKPSSFKDSHEEPGIFNANAAVYGGNGPQVRSLAEGLSEDVPHTLTIEPMLAAGEELRFESICIAGKAPSVQLDTPTR